jgi:hypothetical protein
LARDSSLYTLNYHTQPHHTRKDSSGRVIGPTHRPLSDNTQHSQGTDIYVPAEFKPAISASERLQTHALDRATTVIGNSTFLSPNLPPKCLHLLVRNHKVTSQNTHTHHRENHKIEVQVKVILCPEVLK